MFEVIKSFGDIFQISRINQGIWAGIVMEIIEKSEFFCGTRLGTLLVKTKYLNIIDFYLTNPANIVAFVAMFNFLFIFPSGLS